MIDLDLRSTQYARTGYRVLSFAYRPFDKKTFKNFKEKMKMYYLSADEIDDPRLQKMVEEEYEQDLTFLGVTAVEDHL